MFQKAKNQTGAVPLLVILVAIGLIAIFLISNTFSFKDNLFNSLFPKPPSDAKETIKGAAKDKTIKILSLKNEYNLANDAQKSDALNKLKKAVEDRKVSMLVLAKENPTEFIKLSLSKEVKDKFPKEVQALIEEQESLEGIFKVLHTDDFDNKTTNNFYYINQEPDIKKDPKLISIYFTTEDLTLPINSKVKLTGVRLDDVLVVNSLDKDSSRVLAGSIVPPTKKVAVILFNFQNNNSKPFTSNFAKGVMFTNSNSVKAFYKENSLGVTDLVGIQDVTGDVYGWYTIPYSNSPCDPLNWGRQANVAAENAGISWIYDYDKVVYAFPSTSSCGWAGSSAINIREAYINGTFTTAVVGHELGHTFGSNHNNTYLCTNSSGQYTSISNSCTEYSYGDPFGIMSMNNTYHMNINQKGQTQQIDTAKVQDVTTNGTYTISPIEQQTSGILGIRVPRRKDAQGNPLDYYYVEYRRPFGFDSFGNSDPVVNGTSIRIGIGYGGDIYAQGTTKLIDSTPDGSFYNSSLTQGQTFSDPYQGINITTASITPTQATVNVSFSTPGQCSHANPQVSITPLSQWGNPGQTKNYNLTITNKDSDLCLASTYSIATTIPSGWTQSPAIIPNQTLNAGATISIPFTVTSVAESSEGLYEVLQTISSTLDNSITANTSANYNVFLADITGPTIVINYPQNGGTVTRNKFTNIDTTITDNIGVSSAEFYVNNKKTCTDTTAPYQCSWKVGPKANIVYSIYIKAFDTSGNTSNSSTIQVTSR